MKRQTLLRNTAKFAILTALICFASVTTALSQDSTKTTAVHIGFCYPFSTNGIYAYQYADNVSIHAFVGLSRQTNNLALSGFTNISLQAANGAQLAGFVNYAGGNVHGAQIAGFANQSKDVGTQVAGFVNQANDAGTQVAGFVNVAKNVKGVQISGFVNIADSSNYPIGIINIIKNGEKAIGITTDETLTTFISFRSGGKYTYGIAGVGYNFRNKNMGFATEFGLGAHLIDKNRFRLNAEIVGTQMYQFDNKDEDYFKSSFHLIPVYKISEHIELMLGVSFNHVATNSAEGKDIVPYELYSATIGNYFNAGYIGAIGGVQFTW